VQSLLTWQKFLVALAVVGGYAGNLRANGKYSVKGIIGKVSPDLQEDWQKRRSLSRVSPAEEGDSQARPGAEESAQVIVR
jgi:hypothetical protein